ncbi:nucleoside hydrolase [Amycolatopsis benzoatilytica]|uniref:nucleoside hydrolase n=1 Tax=Amycolatopsis benzoatilytica TaxID=346045 RepID=UPI000365F695|nr:nucleoside hydrolase [Amycolatopsis benzoatilytica]
MKRKPGGWSRFCTLSAISVLTAGAVTAALTSGQPISAATGSPPPPTNKQPWEPAPPKITATQPAPSVTKPATPPAAPKAATPGASTAAVPMIVDTDIYGSADDAGALAIANAMQDNGQVNLLGVMVNYPSKWGAPAVSAINTYYGHGNIPVGSIKPAAGDVASQDYAKYLAQNFPTQITDGNTAPEAVALYRKLLAGAADHSVVIVAIGLETNLANLMNSPADAYSPLDGMHLIAQKVKSLTMMGGQFPASNATDGPEYNWKADASAATQVVNNWPTTVPAEFEGYEVGAAVSTGAGLGGTPTTNPVRVAYERMIGAGASMNSWDPIAMYDAGMGHSGLFADNPDPGSVKVASDGGDKWDTATVKPQHYLVTSAPPDQISSALESLMDQLPATAADPIVAHYNELGGANSYLGKPVGSEYVPTSGGKAQDYQYGAIYWTQASGAHAVHADILAKYLQLGGPASALGYPTTDETGTPDGVGRYNHFSRPDGASIYWTPNTGAHAIYGAIRAKWASMGWERSVLGYPTTDETGTPDGVGRYNHFTGTGGSSIYFTPDTGAHAIYGDIRAKWASMGWERSVLGYPTTDETGTPDGVGRYNHFSRPGGASIYWTPNTGAQAIYGAIRAKWASMGWERSVLGYPTTDETGTPDGVGRYNHFTGTGGASIYWTPDTGAQAIYGAIRAKWASMGWERSFLGYPTSSEYGIPGGRRNDFQHGWISWNASDGAITVGQS